MSDHLSIKAIVVFATLPASGPAIACICRDDRGPTQAELPGCKDCLVLTGIRRFGGDEQLFDQTARLDGGGHIALDGRQRIDG